MSHKKFGPDRFSRFDVYWTQTNKQTDKQTDTQAKFIHKWHSVNFYLINNGSTPFFLASNLIDIQQLRRATLGIFREKFFNVFEN